MTCDLDIYRATKLLVEPHGVRGTETGGASRLDLWLVSESNAARSLSAKVRQGSHPDHRRKSPAGPVRDISWRFWKEAGDG